MGTLKFMAVNWLVWLLMVILMALATVLIAVSTQGCDTETADDAAVDVAADAEEMPDASSAVDSGEYGPAPPVSDWNADEKCGQCAGYWECSCKSGACCPGCEHHWKTVEKQSGDEAVWVLLVTDVTETDSETYKVVCAEGAEELFVEDGKLYAAVSAPNKKVFECVPAEQ